MARRSSLAGSLLLVVAACAAPDRVADRAAREPAAFPDAWIGTWSGELDMHRGPAAAPVPMRLEIGAVDATGERPWRLTYGEQPTRDYRLRAGDGDRPGRWVIDERNDIVLEARFVGDTLVSAFAVQGSLLVTRQRFLPDRIEHEITTFALDGESTGRGVATHDVRGVQRATLRLEPAVK